MGHPAFHRPGATVLKVITPDQAQGAAGSAVCWEWYNFDYWQAPLANTYLECWRIIMKSWSRPDFEEVSLGCEINCYAPAEA